MKKYFEKRKLVKYLKHIEEPNSPWPQWYIDSHISEIDMLKWLIGYYEGRTASSPKEYLEALLNKTDNYQDYVNELKNHNVDPMSEVDRLKIKFRNISFLYNWIYYKKISGF